MYYVFIITFLLFLIYAFIGYIVEIISVSLQEKKLVLSRGYLIGPIIPIYGVGALFMILFLSKYRNDLIVLFFMSMIICTTLEYITSLLMEKIFGLRWWDYSARKFNINGRVCLEYGVLFGLGGIAVINIFNPMIKKLLYSVPSILIIITGNILLFLFILDILESTYIICKLKVNFSKYIRGDATSEIKREVLESLSKNTTLTSRLINAFPHIKYSSSDMLRDFNKMINKFK